jgi:hypothetical protein
LVLSTRDRVADLDSAVEIVIGERIDERVGSWWSIASR